MFDLSAFGLTPEVQAIVLQCALLASLVLPALEKAADATKNTFDNKLVHGLAALLKFVPRVRTGK